MTKSQHVLTASDRVASSDDKKSTSLHTSQIIKPLKSIISNTTFVEDSRKQANNSRDYRDSAYQQGSIPTENPKFEQFLKVILHSLMKPSEMQQDILQYVQMLET